MRKDVFRKGMVLGVIILFVGASGISSINAADDTPITPPCFLAGTHISMVDGSYKNIKQVEPGDLVKSYSQGEIVTGEVTEVYNHSPGEMPDYYLVINDKLRVTPNHIIFVNGEWMPARNITIGDELLGEHNETVVVTYLEQVQEQAPTYNLEICDYNVFFADGILVHNAKQEEEVDPDPPTSNSPPNTPSQPSGPTSVKTPPACFLAGTKVRMADGSYKNIKQIEQGDMVASYNKGVVVSGEVIDVFEHSPAEMADYYVVINDKIRVTPKHFLHVNEGWLPAGEVTVGDELLGESNEAVAVTSVDAVWEQAPTYNLEIDIYHTYFADGILAHNAKAGYKYTTSTTDPNGDAIYYLFNWGDGTDSGWRPTGYAYHLWNTPGTYQVKAKAKDEHGAESGWSTSLSVYVNAAPLAAFTYSPLSPTVLYTVYFTDQSSDSNGYIVSRSWNFGDGDTSTSENPSHTYTSAGTYTVTLTVTDNDGAASSISKNIVVTALEFTLPSWGGAMVHSDPHLSDNIDLPVPRNNVRKSWCCNEQAGTMGNGIAGNSKIAACPFNGASDNLVIYDYNGICEWKSNCLLNAAATSSTPIVSIENRVIACDSNKIIMVDPDPNGNGECLWEADFLFGDLHGIPFSPTITENKVIILPMSGVIGVGGAALYAYSLEGAFLGSYDFGYLIISNSACVNGNRVYVLTNAVGSDDSWLCAIDVDPEGTFTNKWNYPYTGKSQASPTYIDSTIYFDAYQSPEDAEVHAVNDLGADWVFKWESPSPQDYMTLFSMSSDPRGGIWYEEGEIFNYYGHHLLVRLDTNDGHEIENISLDALLGEEGYRPVSVMQICRDEANNPTMIVSANNNLVNCNYVIAIDLTDNSPLWKFQVNSPSNLGNYAGGQYTILLDDNGNNPRLLFGAYFGGVYALGEGGEVEN